MVQRPGPGSVSLTEYSRPLSFPADPVQPVLRVATTHRGAEGFSLARHARWRWRDAVQRGRHARTPDGLRILVLCAWCRRVRNAAGDWGHVPEAWWPAPHVLSHGYCPTCFAHVMADVADEAAAPCGTGPRRPGGAP